MSHPNKGKLGDMGSDPRFYQKSQSVPHKSMCDLYIWPDGGWCYRYEYDRELLSWKGDDFCVVYEDTAEWKEFLIKEDAYD